MSIDATGELDGMKFDSPYGLAKAVHDDPAATACVLQRVYEYAQGRPLGKGDAPVTKGLADAFASNGYQFPVLLRKIAVNDTLYAVPRMDLSLNLPTAGQASGSTPNVENR